MLKRSRAPSPSPTRADPSSPPPLDNNPRLPLPKRRRTVGPSIDSSERREGVAEDDGEDEEDDDCDNTNIISTPDGKVYEHVNHLLHCLHTETQHRLRSAQLHPGSFFAHPNSHNTDPSTLVSPRDPLSLGLLSPFSSQAKSFQDHHSSNLMSTRDHERMMPQEVEESTSGCRDTLHGMTRAIPNNTEVGWGDERVRVTHRYEDTNRLLGSLVLSRRRPLPSVDSE